MTPLRARAGVLLTVGGVLGDLCESLLKRLAGFKGDVTDARALTVA